MWNNRFGLELAFILLVFLQVLLCIDYSFVQLLNLVGQLVDLHLI